MTKLDDVRNLMLEHSKIEPKHAYHVISNLNWYRYVCQVKKIVKNIPHCGNVLDLGCGWGQVTAMIKILRPDVNIMGVDIKKHLSWKSLDKKFGCMFIRDNAESLDALGSNKFDMVISFGVVEHVNQEKFLREIHRILKEGGLNFMFDIPNKYSFSEAVMARLLEFVLRKRFVYHKKKYTENEIKDLLLKHGFENILIKREFVVPAQLDRVSKVLGNFVNDNYLKLDELDKLLSKTFIGFFSQTFTTWSIKKRLD